MVIISVARRLRLGWGKARRFYLVHFNKDYVRRSIQRRHGRCKRCGSCCRLMFKCRYLQNGGDEYECVVHERRRKNCQVFPVDERDIADRDRVSTDGPCGYRFEPTDGRTRWFALGLLVSFGLAALVSGAPAEAQSTVYEVSFRRVRPPAASYPPHVAPNSRRKRRGPTPGWYAASGKWRSEGGGFLAEVAGEIRCDSIEIGRSDFRAEVLADVSGAGEGTLLALEVAGLKAGLSSPAGAFIELCGEVARKELDRSPGRGRFWLVVETGDGLVSVRAGPGRGIRKRDVFRRWRGGEPSCGKPKTVEPRGVRIRAGAGVIVYEVKVRTLAVRERPEVLASADQAMARGDARRLHAAGLYSQAVADDALLPRQRAEAAYKLGLLIKDAEPADAMRAFGRAKTLDPEGPWGERARLELARAALDAGREDLALAFAHRLVKNAAPDLEEWEGFRELVSTARERLVSARQGARSTYALRLIAQHLEWADSPRERALWAWNEVALSYAGRGWHAEANAVRDRAERLLGGGGLLRGLFARIRPKGRSNDAPSVLPESEAGSQ